MPNRQPDGEPGTRLSYWIADALRQHREQAGVPRASLAMSLGVSDATLRRLESGVKMPPDIERRVAAYAWLLGLHDAREIWELALQNWQEHGRPPRYQPAWGPAGAFAEAIRQTALRQREGDASRSKAQPSSPTRRAAR